jgi:predicted DNA-binding transcriptional regulator YafY
MRVLTILELLQTHPQLSGAELAAQLEVDRRSVRRYIVMLQDLGIPISPPAPPVGCSRWRSAYTTSASQAADGNEGSFRKPGG